MFGRGRVVAVQTVDAGDLIPDNRLLPDEADLLEHEAIARTVAEIALTARTPVNIALFGPWGAGKSSIYTMVEKHVAAIAANSVKIARYDAWKYGGKELKRNFVESLARELGLDKDPELSTGLERTVSDTRIAFGSWLWKNKYSLLGGLLAAVGVAAMWVILIAVAATVFAESGFAETAKSLIPSVGTVFGLALLAALLGPKVLEGITVTTETPAPEGADQFAKRFEKLVSKTRVKSRHPLVVFIDELDRCAPSDVVATLRDLKTFLDQPDCAFIVAADREVIVRALREEVAQAKPVREEEPYYATPGAFLDKIFQHQISLPPLRARALTDFARTLADSQHSGLWGEMRAAGSDCYDRVIFALIPVHVRSPRRVKVLLNNFATNVRIAEARGLPWLDRVHEIAVLTVLQTEFPSLIGDLRRVPRLLTYLRNEEQSVSVEVGEIVAKYTTPRTAGSTDDRGGRARSGPAGDEIISDDDSPTGALVQQNASETLRRQLHNYLNKIAAAQIQDPRPDLLYLKPAANRDRLRDPRLGDAIDFATDTAPAQVVDIFADQDSPTLAIVIPLLTVEGDNAVGVGKRFAYESACLLIERLDPNDFQMVADQVHPSLQAALTVGVLTDESLPGALLVAAWSNNSDAIRTFFKSSRAREVPDELLARFTPLLQHVEEAAATDIATLLGERFETAPQPLLTALAGVPISTACALWSEVSRPVVTAINAVELPSPGAPEESAPKSGSPSEATEQAVEPTGDGIVLAEALIETALSRDDGEPLVSDIFATFQRRPTATPIIQWTLTNADRVVAPMGSPTRKARHAMLGILAFQRGAWSRWASFLPPAAENVVDDTLRQLATRLVVRTLLREFAESPTGLSTEELADLTKQVGEWSSVTASQLADVADRTLEAMPWAEAEADAEAQEALWGRKRHFYRVLLDLANETDSAGAVASIVIDDLASVLNVYQLDGHTVTQFAQVCGELPTALVADLSERIDAFDAPSGVEDSVLHLRLLVRGRCGGRPVSVSDLLALERSQRSTAISSAWLSLAPTPSDVGDVIADFPFTPTALAAYADRLAIHDRTVLWIAADRANLADQLMRAIGGGGVDAEAVNHIRDKVTELTREPDRSKQIKRLRLANAATGSANSGSLQRAAGVLARELMSNDAAGDVRSAAELMCWAGGAAHRTKTDLRELFDQQLKAHKNALTKTLFTELETLGLVSKKKSLKDFLFGSER